jgi:hypothetical protein
LDIFQSGHDGIRLGLAENESRERGGIHYLSGGRGRHG